MDRPKIEKIKLEPKTLMKLGRKGNALIVIQSALVLAGMNNFKGTNLKKLRKPKAFIDSKAWKGVQNGDGGAYWLLKEEEGTFTKLYKLAQNATNSINKLEYDKSVKDLVNGFHAIPNIRGKNGKKLKKNSLIGVIL